MFYSLAILLCLAVLFIAASGASLVCGLASRASRRFLAQLPPSPCANFIFVLRALPLFLAGLITLGFALPAFLRFEPRSGNEIAGPRLFVLAALGALVLVAIAVRSWRILRATHRACLRWRARSRRFRMEGIGVPVYCSASQSPLLAVTGFFRPQIFIAEEVVEKLSPDELFAAIAHEVAHVSALDNLKQLVLRITGAPGWISLGSKSEALWLNTSELAADQGALNLGASALDLSSALVKVAGLSRRLPASNSIAASHLVPVSAEVSLEARINHLRHLLESEESAIRSQIPNRNYWPVLSVLIFVVGYAVCVNAILPWMHEMLEVLVR